MNTSLNIQRWLAWGNLLGKFVGVQLIVQALGFVSGLLVLRNMSQHDYAFYTIANTMQGTMNILADLGIGIGVSAIGGRVWQDHFKLGQVVRTALQIRHWLAAISICCVLPFFVYLLRKQGASWGYLSLIIGATVCCLLPQLSASILIAVPRLHAQIKRLQRLDIALAAIKLLLIGGLVYTLINCATIMLVASIVTFLPLLVLRQWAAHHANCNAPTNPEYRREMLTIIKSQTLTGIFYCFQGQINVWLVSVFGKAQSVAEIGALGRIAILYTVLSSVLTSIFTPRFARAQNKHDVRRIFGRIMLWSLCVGICMIILVNQFAPAFLWILGPTYAHLRPELILSTVASSIGFLTGTIWTLCSARAWVLQAWLYIPTTLITQAVLLATMNLRTVAQVILFGMLSQVPYLAVNFYMAWRGYQKEFCNTSRVES